MRFTGRREPEVARRADGVFRAVGFIHESGHDDGAGELQAAVGRLGSSEGKATALDLTGKKGRAWQGQ